MSKLGDLQILEQLKLDINKVNKTDLLDIIQELLNYTVDLEQETPILQIGVRKKIMSQPSIGKVYAGI